MRLTAWRDASRFASGGPTASRWRPSRRSSAPPARIEKQVGYLEEVRKWAETVKGHGEKIADRSSRMVEELRRDVERLDVQIASMRTAETPG